ncbi:hypothetical protein V2W45_1465129 [Cenococcum geophilum]
MSAFPKLTDNSRYDVGGITGCSPAAYQRTNRQENSRRKRKVAESLSGEHFLEANRRKLLGRRDWVGLAPSRPVHVHFQSCKEKERIGKRRRINSRPLPQDGDMMTRHFLRDTEINAREPFMSGAIVTDLEDIKIRIGTDALPSQLPSERSKPVQPAALPRSESPDPMLFDVFDEAHSCKAHSGSAETIGSSIMGPHAQESWRGASARPLCSGQHGGKFIFSDSGELRLAQDLKKNKDDDLGIHGGTGGAPPVATASVKEEQQDYLDSLPKNIHAKKQLRTLPCSFRPVFPSSPFGLSAASPQGVSQGNYAATDLSSNAPATYLDGGDCQRMDVAGFIVHEHGPSEIRIVDDTPWKTFLVISGDGSSHSTTTNVSKESFLQRLQPIEDKLERRVSYRHAIGLVRGTAGDQTVVDTLSSVESSSRPFHSDESLQALSKASGQRAALAQKPAGVPRDITEEVDELWKEFVFGGGDGSPTSDIAHDALLDSVQMRSCSAASSSISTIPLPKLVASGHPSSRNDVTCCVGPT